MNDEQFEALDSRATKAASNVKAAAAQRSRPTFDADRPTTMPQPVAVGQARAPRRTAWVAAAAVVALVAGAVTFAANRPDDGKDTIAAAAVEDPRPYVIEALPDGVGPMAFVELPSRIRDDESLASAMPVYGKVPEEPLAAATVVDAEAFDELGFTATEIGGLTVYRNEASPLLPGQWLGVKRDGSLILLAGATEADAVQLARIVSVVDGSVSVDGESLPDGWRRLTTVNDPMELMYLAARSSSSGYLSAYATGDTATSIQVIAAAGDEPSMWSGRLFLAASRRVTVRGHAGYIGSFPLNDMNAEGTGSTTLTMRSLAWVERPGEVIRMTGLSVSDDELLAAAESIRPAGGDEWRDLVEQSQLGAFGGFYDAGGKELGRTTGTFDDGTKWSLVVTGRSVGEDLPAGGLPEPGMFTELRVALTGDGSGMQGSSSSSSDGGEGFRSVDTTDVGGRFFSSGLVGDEVARVELQTADGSVLGDAQVVEVAGLRAFVTELAEDPTVLVALRADGSEVGRVTIEALDDNVTVDMDGMGQGQVSTFEGQGTPLDSEGKPITEPAQPSPTTVVSGD